MQLKAVGFVNAHLSNGNLNRGRERVERFNGRIYSPDRSELYAIPGVQNEAVGNSLGIEKEPADIIVRPAPVEAVIKVANRLVPRKLSSQTFGNFLPFPCQSVKNDRFLTPLGHEVDGFRDKIASTKKECQGEDAGGHQGTEQGSQISFLKHKAPLTITRLTWGL